MRSPVVVGGAHDSESGAADHAPSRGSRLEPPPRVLHPSPAMRVHQERIVVTTSGRGLVDLTTEVARAVERANVSRGVCHLFARHTSCSLCVQENADPSVLRDLERFLARLAPEGDHYQHSAEGPDDMPAHLRATITRTSESVPVADGRLALGAWQAIYLMEHRRAPHRREVQVTLIGE
jgi:secondary thiamine-phosphate synthase enzyme